MKDNVSAFRGIYKNSYNPARSYNAAKTVVKEKMITYSFDDQRSFHELGSYHGPYD